MTSGDSSQHDETISRVLGGTSSESAAFRSKEPVQWAVGYWVLGNEVREGQCLIEERAQMAETLPSKSGRRLLYDLVQAEVVDALAFAAQYPKTAEGIFDELTKSWTDDQRQGSMREATRLYDLLSAVQS